MAVYKPTLCYPFLSGIDARVGRYELLKRETATGAPAAELYPVEYLTCKIDTSNKNITGYKVRVLGSNNQLVFPPTEATGYISPITELQRAEFGYTGATGDINTGVNGTYLKIPFFQNKNNRLTQPSTYKSCNAIYYDAEYLADHLIVSSALGGSDLTDMENIANWQRDGDRLVYQWPGATPEEQTQNRIELDGEMILSGDIVAAVDSSLSGKCGLWRAEPDSNGGTQLVPVDPNIGVDEKVIILKGSKFHNTCWECTTVSGTARIFSASSTQWTDSAGTSLPLFDCNDTTYKWEITLYQGNFEEVSPVPATGNAIDYPDVDVEWLDMTLSSGKIMGTTGERVQIAGIFPLGSTNYADGVVPGTVSEGETVVLQGTYMGYSSAVPSGIITAGTRVHVKTYDTLFGHAYPDTETLDNVVAAGAQYCQFFKYSNNPKEILDTDMVDCVQTQNISFQYWGIQNEAWTGGPSGYSDQDTWFAEVRNPLNRFIVIQNNPGLPARNLQPGETVLLTGQSDPKQNGVYQYFTVKYAGDPNVKRCLKRAGGYEEWAPYLGKVWFSMSGARGNWQSLARSGAYQLWNPNATDCGNSPIFFTKERPVLLFGNKVLPEHVYTFLCASDSRPSGMTMNVTSVDGFSLVTGDTILFRDGKSAVVINTAGSGTTMITLQAPNPDVQLTDSDYAYITSGQTFAGLVFKRQWNGSVPTANEANWDLYTATIMHNTTTRTFISPWTGLQKNMKLELLNNQTVTPDTSPASNPTRWIAITGLQDKLFYIDHAQLTSALPSYPSNGESEDVVPYRYDIKYFFKTSDENPFYSYEAPYLRLYKDGELFTDLGVVGDFQNFLTNTSQNFIVTDGGGSQLVVGRATPQTTIIGRSVRFSADYVYMGQSSWESYEWLLYSTETKTDENDDEREIIIQKDLLQDTGRRYDKNIDVTFFGLAPDDTGKTSVSKTYLAELRLENSTGDTLSYYIVLRVAPDSELLADSTFKATVDCRFPFVLLETNVPEGGSYSIYRREYNIYQHNMPTLEGCFVAEPGQEYGNFYTDESRSREISPKSTQYLYKDVCSGTEFLYQYHPDDELFYPAANCNVYCGEWEPVLVRMPSSVTQFRDFNVHNGTTYQYIMYKADSSENTPQQIFANCAGSLVWSWATVGMQGSLVPGTPDIANLTGAPVSPRWNFWSICELLPETPDVDAPILKKQYRVDDKNIWLFKYALDTGSQTQEIVRNEFENLGRFIKVGYGEKNYNSGNVTALLGSEIVPGSETRYVERLAQSRVTPLSTNEKAKMLAQWQNFCFSQNPKLLRDIKGQAWIVQVMSNNNTPQNWVTNQPDTISFAWKQIDSANGAIIYGEYTPSEQKATETYGKMIWQSVFDSTGG